MARSLPVSAFFRHAVPRGIRRPPEDIDGVVCAAFLSAIHGRDLGAVIATLTFAKELSGPAATAATRALFDFSGRERASYELVGPALADLQLCAHGDLVANFTTLSWAQAWILTYTDGKSARPFWGGREVYLRALGSFQSASPLRPQLIGLLQRCLVAAQRRLREDSTNTLLPQLHDSFAGALTHLGDGSFAAPTLNATGVAEAAAPHTAAGNSSGMRDEFLREIVKDSDFHIGPALNGGTGGALPDTHRRQVRAAADPLLRAHSRCPRHGSVCRWCWRPGEASHTVPRQRHGRADGAHARVSHALHQGRARVQHGALESDTVRSFPCIVRDLRALLRELLDTNLGQPLHTANDASREQCLERIMGPVERCFSTGGPPPQQQ